MQGTTTKAYLQLIHTTSIAHLSMLVKDCYILKAKVLLFTYLRFLKPNRA